MPQRPGASRKRSRPPPDGSAFRGRLLKSHSDRGRLGCCGFRAAAGNQVALRHGLGDLFLHAADHFADVRVALNTLSDAVLFPRPHDPVERVLRQGSDDFRRDFGE